MYPLEFHFIHTDSEGRIAVLAIFAEIGKENSEYNKLIESFSKMTPSATLANIDMSALIPSERSSWQYKGSMTTPPCNQNIVWNVFNHTVELSVRQVKAFRSLYPMNARPVQPLNGRNLGPVVDTIPISH
jgi:carbonic anhydrase